jgi:hypothetical protein
MTLQRVRQWCWVAAAVRKGRALLGACHDLLRAHRLGGAWARWCAHQARAVRIAGRAEAGWRAVQARLCGTLLEAWVSTCKKFTSSKPLELTPLVACVSCLCFMFLWVLLVMVQVLYVQKRRYRVQAKRFADDQAAKRMYSK